MLLKETKEDANKHYDIPYLETVRINVVKMLSLPKVFYRRLQSLSKS